MSPNALKRAGRILWPFMSLWLVVAGAVLAFCVVQIQSDRAQTLRDAERDVNHLAKVVRVQFVETLDQYELTLTLFRILHERHLAPQPLALMAQTERPAPEHPPERRIDQFDRTGRFVATTDPGRADAPMSVVGRPYFEEARAGAFTGVRLAEPQVNHGDTPIAIPIVKRLQAADGAFDGVLVSTLDPARLLTSLRGSTVSERTSVGVVDRKGRILASTGVTAPAEADTALASIPPGEATMVALAGRSMLAARAELAGGELSVFAALDEDAIYAAHRRHAQTTLVFAGLTLAAVTLALLVAGRRAMREQDRRRQLQRRYAEVRTRSRLDGLTGVANRATFDEQLRLAHAVLSVDAEPFVLAFIDVDRFKALNDNYGHGVGDRALRNIGRILREGVRSNDGVARMGGDEFAVLLPGANAVAMHRVFDSLQERLNAMVARERWPISFSIGVVAFESAPARPRDAINLADRLMYDVKRRGRNGVHYAVYVDGALQHEQDLRKSAA